MAHNGVLLKLYYDAEKVEEVILMEGNSFLCCNSLTHSTTRSCNAQCLIF